MDAGCGSQQYKIYCNHLNYYAQDFGQFSVDELKSFTSTSISYEYGKLDYVGNVWDINEKDETFDAILCTEVLEHIPYPEKTLKEFSRLLKPNGILILTVPSNCLRHMDPFYFSSGYSDRYIKFFLEKFGFSKINIEPVGDYYKWIMVEIYRTARINGLFASLILMPSFIYYFFKQRNASDISINTLCMGYHVTAIKSSARE